MSGCCYLLVWSHGKAYVGETARSVSARMSQHRLLLRSGHKSKLYNGWRKNGDPELIVLATGLNDTPERKAREVEFVRFYDTYNNGYNSSLGGTTNPMEAPETAAKVSGHRNPMKRPEVRAKISGDRCSPHLAVLHADPEYAAKRDAWLTAWNTLPENAAQRARNAAKGRASPKMAEWHSSLKMRSHLREAGAKGRASPKWKTAVTAWNNSPEGVAARAKGLASVRVAARHKPPGLFARLRAELGIN